MEVVENTIKQQTQNFQLLAKIEGLDERHRHCTFENYTVKPENKRQFEVSRDWNFQESMTLTGNTGTGKTHLAIAMLRNFPMIEREQKTLDKIRFDLEWDILNSKQVGRKEYYQKMLDTGSYKFRPARVLIVSVVKMFAELNAAAMGEGKLELLEKYAGGNYDCILFDDMGAEKLTDAKRENLYYIIDERYKNMLPTIITSNFTIQEISEVEPRIASRLAEMGKILLFNGIDYRLNKTFTGA